MMGIDAGQQVSEGVRRNDELRHAIRAEEPFCLFQNDCFESRRSVDRSRVADHIDVASVRDRTFISNVGD